MDLKVFEFLGAEVPNSVGDIREAIRFISNLYRYCNRTSWRKGN